MQKELERVGELLIKKEGKEGPKGKIALLLPPLSRETGEGRGVAGGTRAGGLGARRRPWGGGKGEVAAVVCFPHLIWAEAACGDVATMAGCGGWRQPWWRRCKVRR